MNALVDQTGEYTQKSARCSEMSLVRIKGEGYGLAFLPAPFTPEEKTKKNSHVDAGLLRGINAELRMGGQQVSVLGRGSLSAGEVDVVGYRVAIWPSGDRVAATLPNGEEIIRRRAANFMSDEFSFRGQWLALLADAVGAGFEAQS